MRLPPFLLTGLAAGLLAGCASRDMHSLRTGVHRSNSPVGSTDTRTVKTVHLYDGKIPDFISVKPWPEQWQAMAGFLDSVGHSYSITFNRRTQRAHLRFREREVVLNDLLGIGLDSNVASTAFNEALILNKAGKASYIVVGLDLGPTTTEAEWVLLRLKDGRILPGARTRLAPLTQARIEKGRLLLPPAQAGSPPEVIFDPRRPVRR